MSLVYCDKISKRDGRDKTRLYHIWSNMKQRCFNKKYHGYNRYGGRGITVCEEWAKHFESFRDWSYQNGYDDTKSIDRINNDGNYEPNNCRWADALTQSRNTSRNHPVKYNGIVYRTQTELAEALGIKVVTLKARIRKGLPVDMPLREHKEHKRAKNGKIYIIKGWEGVSLSVVKQTDG